MFFVKKKKEKNNNKLMQSLVKVKHVTEWKRHNWTQTLRIGQPDWRLSCEYFDQIKIKDIYFKSLS